MRSTRQRLAAATLIAGFTSLGVGLTAGPASADMASDCRGYLGKTPSGSLGITSSPGAGSSVPVGSTIGVSGTWDEHDYKETDKFFVCVETDGAYNEAMSSLDRGVDNSGSHSGSVTVPASVPAGSSICIVSGLRGQAALNRTTMELVSEKLCFTAAAVVTPTTTAPTTTTTAAPVVEPEVVQAGNPAPPGVEAAPAPVEAPAPQPVLPRTGAGIELLARFGSLALAGGGVARFLGRRRTSEG